MIPTIGYISRIMIRPAPHSEILTTLDKLAPSDEAVVTNVEASPELRRRLMEAGFVTGSRVRFLMATPFGDPLVFSLRGASIALRKIEAHSIHVRVA